MSNSSLLKMAVFFGLLSLAISLLNILQQSNKHHNYVINRPLSAHYINSNREILLNDIIDNNKYTIIWVIMLSCPSCPDAIKSAYNQILQYETNNIPVLIVIDDYTEESFLSARSKYPNELHYINIKHNMYDVLGFIKSPSCYLVDTHRRILNSTHIYPESWHEICTLTHNSDPQEYP